MLRIAQTLRWETTFWSASGAFTLLFGIGPIHSPAASAAEPPPCSKPSVMSHVKQAYGGMLMLENSTRKFRLEDPRETGYGPAAPGANQYTPSKDYYNKSRYCEADIKLNNGDSEKAYYRLDGRNDDADIDYNFSPCFIKHNTRKDDCVDERPGKK
jgi:hypothetical protein